MFCLDTAVVCRCVPATDVLYFLGVLLLMQYLFRWLVGIALRFLLVCLPCIWEKCSVCM
jgi:hypothetical protein